MFDQSNSKVSANLTELKLWNPFTKRVALEHFKSSFNCLLMLTFGPGTSGDLQVEERLQNLISKHRGRMKSALTRKKNKTNISTQRHHKNLPVWSLAYHQLQKLIHLPLHCSQLLLENCIIWDIQTWSKSSGPLLSLLF